MTELTFEPWPKIARLNRDCIITEKIDGTNAAVIVQEGVWVNPSEWAERKILTSFEWGDTAYTVGAQSRNRLITPEADNFGFAQWVKERAVLLAPALGAGRHFGEWWGSGIGRGYGLQKGEKRFSLFNVSRYADVDFSNLPGVALVPTLYTGPFTTEVVADTVAALADFGSHAAPGFMRPEGVVVFHTAAQTVFKVTVEKDEAPKGQVAA